MLIPTCCRYGQNLYIVGSLPQLGGWDLSKALPLSWHPGHRWSAEVVLPVDSFEFKAVVVEGAGRVAWEDGANRTVRTSEHRSNYAVNLLLPFSSAAAAMVLANCVRLCGCAPALAVLLRWLPDLAFGRC